MSKRVSRQSTSNAKSYRELDEIDIEEDEEYDENGIKIGKWTEGEDNKLRQAVD